MSLELTTLYRLKAYGLTDNSMKLVNSYFQDLKNRTRIQDNNSNSNNKSFNKLQVNITS